jgi:seryl-tRNA synthetase
LLQQSAGENNQSTSHFTCQQRIYFFSIANNLTMLRRFASSTLVLRRHISALYVTGDKAMENFVVLTPILNFEERFENLEEIKENFERRKLSVNLEELKSEYDVFKKVNDRKKSMEARRTEIAKLIKESPTEELKIQGKHLREDLKQLKENSYHLEDTFVHNFLNLPNFIHERVPKDGKKVIYSFKDDAKNVKSQSNSIDELVEFYDPTCYYMKGEAAKFDVFMPMHVSKEFQESGYVPFSNPDFTRSVIAEGAGVDSKEIYLLKEDDIDNKLNLLHLTGNASFLNYLSFVSKLTVFPSLLPLKLICTGKQYDARNHYDHQDLYRTVQSTCCQTFIATTDGSSFDEIINEQVQQLAKLFEPFGQHFQIVFYPADAFKRSESCRIGVEMFSPLQKSYIEVGNFSYYGDFISKRLLFNYKVGKDFHFPHIYSGTAVNVMKLLLVLIENGNKFECPNWLIE